MQALIKVGFLFLTLLFVLKSNGQVSPTPDSLLVKKNAAVVYTDTTIVFKKDSLISFPDSLIRLGWMVTNCFNRSSLGSRSMKLGNILVIGSLLL